MLTFPTQRQLSTIFNDEGRCLAFLLEHGACDMPTCCAICRSEIAIHGHNWRCKKPGCRKQESFLKTSFFGQSRMPCNEILEIGYYWLANCGHSTIMQITGHSSATITDYMKFYRQLVEGSLSDVSTLIGGEGVEVRVDESKFGKRKYHRGHRVDGVWVIGGVEVTEERKLFVQTVSNRNRDTILKVLSKHIKPGSILITDCWKGYLDVEEQLNVRHLTVNHTLGFKNDDTGACTNHIEGTWNAIKLQVPPRNRTRRFISGYLNEFIWRRQNVANLWEGLLTAFKAVGY
jgi:transposase-like protein